MTREPYVDLHDLLGSDPKLKAWIDEQGLVLREPFIHLQVRSLTVRRGLTLLTDRISTYPTRSAETEG